MFSKDPFRPFVTRAGFGLTEIGRTRKLAEIIENGQTLGMTTGLGGNRKQHKTTEMLGTHDFVLSPKRIGRQRKGRIFQR